MTAVIRSADARRSASTITSNSIRFSFTGGLVGWITKTSSPRTLSSMRTPISPSANRKMLISDRGTSSPAAISCARAGLPRPPNSFRRGPWEESRGTARCVSTNGVLCMDDTVLAPALCCDISDHPGRHAHGHPARRDVLVDDRSCTGHGSLADANRCDEHGVAADEGLILDVRVVLAGPVVVAGDRSGADVDAGTDGDIAEITHVVDLGVVADRGILQFGEVPDLDEAAYARPRAQAARHQRLRCGQLLPRVDADRLLRAHHQRRHLLLPPKQPADRIREVVLPLSVAGGERAQCLTQGLLAKHVRPGVDLRDLAFFARAIGLFHNLPHAAVAVPDHPAVPGGIRHPRAQQRGGRSTRAVQSR